MIKLNNGEDAFSSEANYELAKRMGFSSMFACLENMDEAHLRMKEVAQPDQLAAMTVIVMINCNTLIRAIVEGGVAIDPAVAEQRLLFAKLLTAVDLHRPPLSDGDWHNVASDLGLPQEGRFKAIRKIFSDAKEVAKWRKT